MTIEISSKLAKKWKHIQSSENVVFEINLPSFENQDENQFDNFQDEKQRDDFDDIEKCLLGNNGVSNVWYQASYKNYIAFLI